MMKKNEPAQVVHPFEPVIDSDAKVLILGSLPSVKSREQNFYYGHPQNRFWKVIANITDSEVPVTIEQKKELLRHTRIAVWDVIASCTIIGSSDASIKDVKVNAVDELVEAFPIRAIFCNGKTAEKYCRKYLQDKIDLPMITLPSTSPANAAWKTEALCETWKKEITPWL